MSVGGALRFVLCRVGTSELLDRRALILGRSFVVAALGADDLPPRVGLDVTNVRPVKMGQVVVLVSRIARLVRVVSRHGLTPANPWNQAIPLGPTPLAAGSVRPDGTRVPTEGPVEITRVRMEAEAC